MNLIWFRNDLRVDDNPALFHAAKNTNTPVAGVYFLCKKQWRRHQVGSNQQALIVKALQNLRHELSQLGIPLIVIDASEFDRIHIVFRKLIEQLQVTDVYFNIEYPINERRRDKHLIDLFAKQVTFHRYVGDSLVAPWKVVNGQGQGYKVFSAFARAAYKLIDEEPLIAYPIPIAREQNLTELNQKFDLFNADLPAVTPSAQGIPLVGASHLNAQLDKFIQNNVSDYQSNRDFPGIDGTSELSAPLAIGALSVRRCYQQAKENAGQSAHTWINELMWRDFYRSVMWHYPHVCQGKAFNAVEKNIIWSQNNEDLLRWQNGQTGIPIIDAAMMQLRSLGWMHNRLRMIVASYLTKNLWLDWRLGEMFFSQHLFDFDFASNNGGWQWCSSVGTDAAPYFRIFNPAAQQKKFDPQAKFIKHWIPQLESLSAKEIHQFESKQLPNYPSPQVDLKVSRKAAIETFKAAKSTFVE